MSGKNNEKVVYESACLFCERRDERDTPKAKPTDAFIKSEMVAEEHIDSIKAAIQELTLGNIDSCLDLLSEIETEMEVTLAFGELFDIENNGNRIH